jgi:hypothetical protein
MESKMKIDWIETQMLACGGIPVGQDDLNFLHEQGIRAIVTSDGTSADNPERTYT